MPPHPQLWRFPQVLTSSIDDDDDSIIDDYSWWRIIPLLLVDDVADIPTWWYSTWRRIQYYYWVVFNTNDIINAVVTGNEAYGNGDITPDRNGFFNDDNMKW